LLSGFLAGLAFQIAQDDDGARAFLLGFDVGGRDGVVAHFDPDEEESVLIDLEGSEADGMYYRLLRELD
jgi:hypothetical protein